MDETITAVQTGPFKGWGTEVYCLAQGVKIKISTHLKWSIERDLPFVEIILEWGMNH